jgi:hypothetical protein
MMEEREGESGEQGGAEREGCSTYECTGVEVTRGEMEEDNVNKEGSHTPVGTPLGSRNYPGTIPVVARGHRSSEKGPQWRSRKEGHIDIFGHVAPVVRR